MDKNTFGQRLKYFRKQRNLTQVEFAEMIDITDKALSKIEVGKAYPHLNTLISISKVLNVSLDFLVSDSDSVGKEVYINEIMKKIDKMELYTVKHILEYIDLYTRNEKERENLGKDGMA